MHRPLLSNLAHFILPRIGRWTAVAAWIGLVLGRNGSARASDAKCPRAGGGWIDLLFSGTAWSPAQQEGVVRELRIELSRRSLEVCPHTEDVSASPPAAVVTLLSDDLDRISIVPSRLQDEGGFSGRTIRLGSIPEDARALAIAQAVDEALRGVSVSPEPPLPAPNREVPTRDAPTPAPAPRSAVRLAVSIGPVLEVAPTAFTAAGKTVLAPGAALRVAITNSRFGGSIGVVLGRSTDFVFDSVSISQFRLPVDASFRLLLQTGQLRCAIDAGALVALLREEYTALHRAHQEVEAGARAGVTLSWGDRIVPWLGASTEVLPAPFDFRFAPMGAIGHTSSLWLGFALGMEVRWP